MTIQLINKTDKEILIGNAKVRARVSMSFHKSFILSSKEPLEKEGLTLNKQSEKLYFVQETIVEEEEAQNDENLQETIVEEVLKMSKKELIAFAEGKNIPISGGNAEDTRQEVLSALDKGQ